MAESTEDNKVVDFKYSDEQRLENASIRLVNDELFSALVPEFVDLVNRGYPKANYYLGIIYEDGDASVDPDLKKALFYYQQSAEEAGLFEGMLAVAKFYYYGLGIEKDYEAAYGWYSLAAEEADNAIAQMMLGRMHHMGLGVETDYVKAEEFYNQSIKKGNVYALAYLGQLKEAQGRKLKGFLMRYKAGILGAYLAWKDQSDDRLRRG